MRQHSLKHEVTAAEDLYRASTGNAGRGARNTQRNGETASGIKRGAGLKSEKEKTGRLLAVDEAIYGQKPKKYFVWYFYGLYILDVTRSNNKVKCNKSCKCRKSRIDLLPTARILRYSITILQQHNTQPSFQSVAAPRGSEILRRTMQTVVVGVAERNKTAPNKVPAVQPSVFPRKCLRPDPSSPKCAKITFQFDNILCKNKITNLTLFLLSELVKTSDRKQDDETDGCKRVRCSTPKNIGMSTGDEQKAGSKIGEGVFAEGCMYMTLRRLRSIGAARGCRRWPSVSPVALPPFVTEYTKRDKCDELTASRVTEPPLEERKNTYTRELPNI
ncbi:hypothetical protein EAG_07228 [Camponotus floridanus]|uniref:Uncharacterized protein n=1 Tax=Camponotus floridanus TaxID=104421 RepID=E2AMM5_CAMFO|nr:hypothetical protein EAG_07228 [Camponotus floridanus]